MSSENEFYWVLIDQGPPFKVVVGNKPLSKLSDALNEYPNSDTSYTSYADLPKWLQRKLSLLLTVNNAVIIDGVGQRINEGNFLIYK